METPTMAGGNPDGADDRHEHRPEAPVVVSVARTEAEREEIYRFRYDVYVREMGKLDMDDADHAGRRVHDLLDDVATLYVARQKSEDGSDVIVGTLRLVSGADAVPQRFLGLPAFDRFHDFDDAALSFTSRLMVAPGQRGSVAMHALVARAYGDALDGPTQFDFCICAPGLVELYEHLGYRRFTGNVADPVIGYMVPLVLVARDAEHLRAVRSPLWRLLRNHPSAAEGAPVAQWLKETMETVSAVRQWAADPDLYWRFLSDKVRESASGRASILEGLSEEEQRQLFKAGTLLDAAAGDRIITTGTVGTEMFVVLSGMVEVRLPGAVRPLAVLDVGQVFGEIAFLADTHRTADVTALTESRVLVLSRGYLQRLMKAVPDLASKLLFNLSRVLCERLVTSNRDR